MDKLSDNALMIRVRDGDLDRLGLLFERYKRPLYGFFYGMNKDQELSDDLVQNTFYRVMKYRHLFRVRLPEVGSEGLSEGDFKAWLFHIARNVRHDHFRKEKIKGKDPVENWEHKLGHSENRSEEMQQDEEHMMLGLAMDRLSPEKREVLLLSKYQEKKYKEIGDMLGCTEGAVKVKVFRALQELKAVYEKLEKQM